jgi:hypothetical protein
MADLGTYIDNDSPTPIDTLPPSTGDGSDPPADNPWTADDVSAARSYFVKYIADHNISSWGTPEDALNVYYQQRRSGVAHDAALTGALHRLGWDQAGSPTALPPPSAPNPRVPGEFPTNGPSPYDPVTPNYPTAPQFSYPDFVAPSFDSLYSDPSVAFRIKTGADTFERSAAARGTLNDGGTAKGLIDYGQNAASQEYQNMFGRAQSAYALNRTNALDTFNGQEHAFDIGVQSLQHDTDQNRLYARMGLLDAFDRWYRTNQLRFQLAQ